MCGICGILCLGTGNTITRELLDRMNDQIAHRGPDAQGIYLESGIGLGHRRLKIIDLEGGVQPMFSADNNIVLVFNGEIFNFAEVRAQLENRGHIFRTHSDTEVIIQAYIEYGESCVDHFRGMFAIALFDKHQHKLILIRDRLGIKPIYYFLDDNTLIFASEIKSILTAIKSKPGVNISALEFYISVGYSPGEETLFDGIKKLNPGHMLVAKNNNITISQYWDLKDYSNHDVSFETASEQFAELVTESVKLRMISDVPIGAFLSGGLDSSVIVGMMSQLSSDQVKTFSVGYEDDIESNELGYARTVANHFQTDHHEFVLKPTDFFNSMETLLNHTEEPIVESAAVALYQLSKLAKEHVTVILSGEGGDEILAGYPLHQTMPRIDKLHSFVKFIPAGFQRMIASALMPHEKRTKYWDWSTLPMERRYQSISNDVTYSIKQEMYEDGALLDAHRQTSQYYTRLYNHLQSSSKLHKMAYSDIKSWLPDDLLVKADKMTMAAALELRVPFLDHKLVEFSTSLPDQYRLNGKQGKFMLKKFAESMLPREIIYRKKKGFPVPISNWFQNDLYQKTAEILLDSSSIDRGYFKRSYVEKMLSRHRQGSEDLSRRIFSMLNLELWHRKYID